MAEHVTRRTEYVIKWCDHCQRNTEHACSDARVGRCVEDHHPRKTPAAKPPEPQKQGRLF